MTSAGSDDVEGGEEDGDEGDIMDAMFGERLDEETAIKGNSLAAGQYLCNDDLRTKKKDDYCLDKIYYRDFCRLMERIASSREGTKAKAEQLLSFVRKSVVGPQQSLYPFLRLVLPVNDVERGKIGLKQSSLARTYINALHLDKKTSTAAMQLIFFKDPAKRNAAIHSSSSSAAASSAAVQMGGDFSDVLEDVLKERVQTDFSAATLREVHSILDALAAAPGEKAQTAIIRDRVINRFNATEQKWLARIIYRDLKIGLSVETVFKHFYPAAVDRYNETGSIRQVCEEEGGGGGDREGDGLGKAGLQVFTKFNPMLAKGFNKEVQTGGQQVAAVEAAMKGQPFAMDVKLDGERICAHVGRRASSSSSSREVMLVTRSGTDYTDNYRQLAESVERGVLAGHEAILDGEVLAWDSIERRHVPFGNNSMVAKKERERAAAAAGAGAGEMGPPLTSWMKYVVFDLLYFAGPQSESVIRSVMRDFHMVPQSNTQSQSQSNSQSQSQSQSQSVEAAAAAAELSGDLTRLPLMVRRALLQRVLAMVPERIEPVRTMNVTEIGADRRRERQAALEEFFNEVVAQGEEGLVVKLLGSEYLLGEKSRAAGHWVKMKPEYGDQTADLDLAILGGYYGESGGERGQGVAKFLCGVRDDRDPDLFYTLAKVGTGYSVSELRELRQRLQPAVLSVREGQTEFAHLPDWTLPPRSKFRPDVLYDPRKSVVLQFKCGGIVDSVVYSSGLALRFPRVERIRYDKPCAEVLTKAELYGLKDNFRKSTAAEEGRDPDLIPAGPKTGPGKKRQQTKRAAGAPAAQRMRIQGRDEQLHAALLSGQQQQQRTGSGTGAGPGRGPIFRGWVFCVFDCDFAIGRRLQIAAFPSLSSCCSSSSGGADRDEDEDGDGPLSAMLQDDDKVRVYHRRELIDMILSEGGTVVATATSPEVRVVASSLARRSLQLDNLVKAKSRDVIDFSFLLDCLAAGKLLPLRNTYFLSRGSSSNGDSNGDSNGAMGAACSCACDLFGLGFDEELDPAGPELQRLLGGMGPVIQAAQSQSTCRGKGKGKGKPAAPSSSKAATATARSAGTTTEEGREEGEEERCLLEDVRDLADLTWRDILTRHIHPIAASIAAACTTASSDDQQHSDLPDPDPDPDLVLPSANRLWCGGRLVFFLEGGGGGGCQVLRQRMLLQGAVMSERLDQAVTHVVLCGPRTAATTTAITAENRSNRHRYRLVAAPALEEMLLLLLAEGAADPAVDVDVEAALQAISVPCS